MRSFVSIGIALTGIWTVLSGLVMLIVPPIDSHAHHVAPAILFVIFMVLHTWLNWKPLLLRFRGLGWKWALVGVVAVIIMLETTAHFIR